MKLKDLLSLASKEANKSTCKHKLGAVALSNGQVVSKAFNRHMSADKELYRKGESTIHAEALALRRTGNRKVDTIVVVRNGPDSYKMAMPCKRCVAAMKRSGVKQVVYTDWFGVVQKTQGVIMDPFQYAIVICANCSMKYKCFDIDVFDNECEVCGGPTTLLLTEDIKLTEDHIGFKDDL